MNHLSTNAKERIVRKILSKDNDNTIKEIAKIHNIGESTLQKWLKRYREHGTINIAVSGKSNRVFSLVERFNHLMATSSLDDTKIGSYCREHGLFSFQLTQWKEEFMSQQSSEKQQAYQSELKSLRMENKQLKQDIRRKDSALAETTSLLVLKKKASLIWGGAEDD